MAAVEARYPDLAGRTVFVTGGGSGIGAAFVRAFAGQGCQRRLRRHRRRALARPGRRASRPPASISSTATSATSPRSSARSPPRRRRSGPITVLVNNAARDDRHAMMDVTRRVLGREPGGQPAPPGVRDAGGRPDDGGGGRRLDHQPRLDFVDARAPGDGGLHDGEGGDRRPDARARARARRRRTSASTRSCPARSSTERQTRLWTTPDGRARVPRAAVPQVPAVRGRRRAHARCSSRRTTRAASPART